LNYIVTTHNCKFSYPKITVEENVNLYVTAWKKATMTLILFLVLFHNACKSNLHIGRPYGSIRYLGSAF